MTKAIRSIKKVFLGVVQKLRQQFWNYFELLFPYSEKNVCTYETDRIGEKQPKETGNVNLIFERLLTTKRNEDSLA
jgi:hypothetical protein